MSRTLQLINAQIERCEHKYKECQEELKRPGSCTSDYNARQLAGDELNSWKAARNLIEIGIAFSNPKPIQTAPIDRRVLLYHPMRGWITGQWEELLNRWAYCDRATFGMNDEKNNQPLVWLELPQ